MSKQSNNTAADDENMNTTTIDVLNKELETSCQIGTNNNEKKKKDTISLSSTTTTTYLSSCLKSKTGLQTRELFGGAIQMNIPTYWRDVSQVRQVPDNQEVFQDCTDNNDNDNDDDQNNNKKKKKELLSYEGTNGCIVIELLERQNDVLDNDAPRFFVDDLVESTDKDDNDNDDDALPPSPHNTKTNISSKLQKKAVIQHQTIWQKQQQQQQQNTNTTTMNSKEKKSSTKSSSHNQQQHQHQHHLASNFQSVATACSCFALHKLEGSESSGSSSGGSGDGGGVQIELCVIRLEDIQTDLLVILTVPIQQDTTTTTMKKKKKETTDDAGGLERIEIENSKHTILFWRIVSSLLIKDWSLFC